MNGHDRSTNINENKKGKHRERSKLHPFSPICSHIYIYIHMAMYIYICIYTETDPPTNKKEGSQIAWRDGRFETEVPSTEEEK